MVPSDSDSLLLARVLALYTVQGELQRRAPGLDNEMMSLRVQNDKGGGEATSDNFAWPHDSE